MSALPFLYDEIVVAQESQIAPVYCKLREGRKQGGEQGEGKEE
jgi:hypothetical protein